MWEIIFIHSTSPDGTLQLPPGLKTHNLLQTNLQTTPPQNAIIRQNPIAPQRLLRRNPLPRIDLQHAHDQLPRLQTDVSPKLIIENIIPGPNFIKHGGLSPGRIDPEGRSSRQEHEERASRGPDVASRSVGDAGDEFGGYVGGRAAFGFHGVMGFGVGGGEGEAAGEAEVGEFEVGVVVFVHEEEVLLLCG